jgi:hypothetical protein
LLSVVEKPTHTTDEPVIVPASGVSVTVTGFVAVAVPHTLVTVYVIVSGPGVIPVTIPPATDALLVVTAHPPPGTGSVNTIVEPIHTLARPVITPADASGFTVTGHIAEELPQELNNVYVIVSTPPATPVTIPAGVTEAFPVVTPHEPPGVGSVNVMIDATHTLSRPEMPATTGNGSTVTVIETLEVPQAFDLVKVISAVPADTPVTIPPGATVATPVLELLHAPACAVSISIIVADSHTVPEPVIGLTPGALVQFETTRILESSVI